MNEIPAGHGLSWQWQSNRLAVLGDDVVTVLTADGSLIWSLTVVGATSLAWDDVNDLLMVGTADGELLALGAVDGAERGRWRLGEGAVAVAVEVPGRGRAILEDGSLFQWGEPLAEPALAWKLAGPVGEALGGQWLRVRHDQLMELEWTVEGWKHTTCTAPQLIAVGAAASGRCWWIAADDPSTLVRVRLTSEGQLRVACRVALPVEGVIGVCGSSHAGSVFLYTADEVVLFDGERGGKVLARLTIAGATAIAHSIDGKHVAVTGPGGGMVFGYKKWVQPNAKKPDLDDLDDLPEFVDAVQRWVYRVGDVEERLRELLWDAFYDLTVLDELPEPVRVWILTNGFDHWVDCDGLCFSFGNFPEQGRLLPGALIALGLEPAAQVAREAYAFFEQSTLELASDQTDAWYALAEKFDDRYSAACKKAPAARMALLNEHGGLFASVRLTGG